MHDRTVPNVRALLQQHRRPGKDVNHPPFLHVAPVADDDRSPVGAKRGAGTHIDVSSDDDVPRYRGLRMHERRFVNDRPVPVELVECHSRSSIR